MMNKRLAIMVIQATLLGAPVLTADALAAGPSSTTTKQYGTSGTIDAVMAGGTNLVINDSVYKLSPATRIYTSNGGTAYSTSLKKGVKINFNVDYRQDPKSPVITEILLP